MLQLLALPGVAEPKDGEPGIGVVGIRIRQLIAPEGKPSLRLLADRGRCGEAAVAEVLV
ncbi:hypothetical protein [Nocardia sp. NPDC004604]|uniref:hypothetical protein n=1 Tax=Nocardia sp. NPDC004604 TaxID=3157013 RepID=UPI0033BC07BE